MSNPKMESWLHLSSTVAVLLGVALIVFELRQTSDLVELQIIKQDAEGADERALSVLPDNVYEIRQKSIDDPENLTHMEYRAMDAYLWYRVINRWRSLYDLAERGLVDDAVWQRSVREDVRPYLAYPFGRAYWKRLKEVAAALPPDLVDAVDAALSDAPYDYSSLAYSDVLKRIEAEK